MHPIRRLLRRCGQFWIQACIWLARPAALTAALVIGSLFAVGLAIDTYLPCDWTLDGDGWCRRWLSVHATLSLMAFLVHVMTYTVQQENTPRDESESRAVRASGGFRRGLRLLCAVGFPHIVPLLAIGVSLILHSPDAAPAVRTAAEWVFVVGLVNAGLTAGWYAWRPPRTGRADAKTGAE